MAVVEKKEKKPTSPPLHPPYFQMITEAITSLKDRTGSSQPAIAKFVEDKYKSKLLPNFRKMLSVQLRRFSKSEKLTKVKNSYKISKPVSDPAPAKKKTTAKKAAPEKMVVEKKKKAVVKTAKVVKKNEGKKVVKMMKAVKSPVKAKKRVAKSIKAPAKSPAKRARRA